MRDEFLISLSAIKNECVELELAESLVPASSHQVCLWEEEGGRLEQGVFILHLFFYFILDFQIF